MDWSAEYWAVASGRCPEGTVCGVDEAGRGPLAGDVFAAAVILPLGLDIPGLRDSKKLSERKREELYGLIRQQALACCVARASVEEIGQYNILWASMLAMRRAVEGLGSPARLALVDGNIARGFGIDACPIVGGDDRSPSIAAASILAKVERDRYMAELDAVYPKYFFAQHMGYPTKLHKEMIARYGLTPIHRKGFRCD